MEKSNKIVFVSGNFFVLHPGHIRLLRFASECGEKLFVGVNNTRPSLDYPSVEERAETLKELGIVHKVVILNEGLESYIKKLKPDLIVKGKEYEGADNPETIWLKTWGGNLLFASGQALYSGNELLGRSGISQFKNFNFPTDYFIRHHLSSNDLFDLIDNFQKLNILVIGDLIIDEYIQCDALGMSREDPTLVISPQKSHQFLGGAGIVAAHSSSLGAKVTYFSAVGADKYAKWGEKKLREYGVNAELFVDESRPTTLKQRYRVDSKTLMRVSHLRQHEISIELQDMILEKVKKIINSIDLLIFSDFNYGFLPQRLVENLISMARKHGIFMAADSQSSSQMGDISRFKSVNLITPTEYEARLSLRNLNAGLHIIAKELLQVCNVKHGVITLGSAGVLAIQADDGGNYDIDLLQPFNINPVDVSGAGDSFLVMMAMALACKSNSFEAAYLGNLGAAIQVARVGNTPISMNELRQAVSMIRDSEKN